MQVAAVAVGAGHAVVGQIIPAQAPHRAAGGEADGEQVAEFVAGTGAGASDCRVSPRMTCRSCLTCWFAGCLTGCPPRPVSISWHFFSWAPAFAVREPSIWATHGRPQENVLPGRSGHLLASVRSG